MLHISYCFKMNNQECFVGLWKSLLIWYNNIRQFVHNLFKFFSSLLIQISWSNMMRAPFRSIVVFLLKWIKTIFSFVNANIHVNLSVSVLCTGVCGAVTSGIGGVFGEGSLFMNVVLANPLLTEFFLDGPNGFKRDVFLPPEGFRCICISYPVFVSISSSHTPKSKLGIPESSWMFLVFDTP